MKKILLLVSLFLNITIVLSQTTITGTVNDASLGGTLPGANIKVTGKAVGTTTDFDGKFTLQVSDNPPFSIEISSLGYQSKTIGITKNNQVVNVALSENATSLDEVVISASRTPERIMESPVTVERLDARAIKNTTAASFYDGLENLKGVDINSNSLTFKSVNTRGFATFANTRFMQLVDGMDNSSPALNFALGNLVGLSELDVQSVELLPGASSALYGANAFNGIMFMTSKSPFDITGVSASAKSGVTYQDAAGINEFFDASVRLAHKFNDKFAAKATVSYLKGTEWFATDTRNTNGETYIAGDRNSDINFNGLNIYGDEVTTNIKGVAEILETTLGEDGNTLIPGGASALIPNVNVSRTGYEEVDLMDYEAESLKAGVSLNYRPWGDERLEIILNSKAGIGNTIYQGANRYSIKNFLMHQHKLEFKGENFFVRGYATIEDAGDSYDTRFTAINVNRRWKDDETWFGEYVGGFLTATLGGAATDEAHAIARSVADTGRFLPGTDEFNTAFNDVINDPDLSTGSKFQDESRLYHVDANYNFRELVDFAEIQVGGSYRLYSLRSSGTIYTDFDGPIDYDEYGVYTQIQKKFLEDRLKLTGSIRYDKALNFDGNFSPRVSLAYAAGENKNHNFRASWQRGFRNPTTQDQYIGLNVGNAFLIGSAPDNLDRYSTPDIDLSGTGSAITGQTAVSVSGRQAYENAFSLSSVQAGAPVAADVNLVQPETVTAYEVGYRSAVPVGEKRLTIDLSVYYNEYDSFIANENVAVPLYGSVDFTDFAPDGVTPLALAALSSGDFEIFNTYTNTEADITSYGTTLGLNTKIFNGYNIGLNYTYSKFDFDQDSDHDFEAGFNTPEHKVKLQFGHPNVYKNFGFNINARWQDEYLWESTFHDAVIDARTVIDAQVNCKVPSLKSTFKLGGTNLTGQEYLSAPGVGAIGTQYYLAWTFNN